MSAVITARGAPPPLALAREHLPASDLHRSRSRNPVPDERFEPQNHHARKQQIPPDALVAFLLHGRSSRQFVPGGAAPPARPSAPATSSCGSIGVRSDSPRSTLLATVIGGGASRPCAAHLVETLLGQLEHVRPFSVERHALTRRGQHDARLDLAGRARESGRRGPARAHRRRSATTDARYRTRAS